MKTQIIGPARTAGLLAGALILSLLGAGCHRNPPPPPLPANVRPVDSSKPPPDMQRLYQNSHMSTPGGGHP